MIFLLVCVFFHKMPMLLFALLDTDAGSRVDVDGCGIFLNVECLVLNDIVRIVTKYRQISPGPLRWIFSSCKPRIKTAPD